MLANDDSPSFDVAYIDNHSTSVSEFTVDCFPTSEKHVSVESLDAVPELLTNTRTIPVAAILIDTSVDTIFYRGYDASRSDMNVYLDSSSTETTDHLEVTDLRESLSIRTQSILCRI